MIVLLGLANVAFIFCYRRLRAAVAIQRTDILPSSELIDKIAKNRVLIQEIRTSRNTPQDAIDIYHRRVVNIMHLLTL